MMENKEENILMERFSLCRERISQVGEELLPEAAFRDYFYRTAKQTELFIQEYLYVAEGKTEEAGMKELQERNRRLYADIFLKITGKAMPTPLLRRRPLERNSGRFFRFWRRN